MFSRLNFAVFNELCDVFETINGDFITLNFAARELATLGNIASYGVDCRDREAVKQAIRETVKLVPEEFEILYEDGEFIYQK